MRSRIRATQIPLPFATAGVGLCLSYIFSRHINAPAATLIGFLCGVLALYLSGRMADNDGDGSNPCPKCGASVQAMRLASNRERALAVALKQLKSARAK
jgi:hypothetical protein